MIRQIHIYYREKVPLFIRKPLSEYREYLAHQRLRKTEGSLLHHFDKNQCIFIHIPKCAGISVEKSLFGDVSGGHITAGKFRRIFGETNFKRYYKFTFVRNPWDRLLSTYNFLNRGGINEMDKKWADNNLVDVDNFEEFVFKKINPDAVLKWIHLIPQYKFLVHEHGSLQVDFIGYFERLEEDYNRVRDALGIGATLLHLNQGNISVKSNKYYRRYYSQEMKEIVQNVYWEDIKFFGYNF